MIKLSLLFPALIALCLQATTVAQNAKPEVDLKLKVEADFLALRVSGSTPEGATTLQYRFVEKGRVQEKDAWVLLAQFPAREFKFHVPLPASRWGELQVRVLKKETELAKKSARPKRDDFEWLTPEAIQALPATERESWTAYMARSAQRRDAEFDRLAEECRQLQMPKANPAPGNRGEFEIDSATRPEWFASEEAAKLTEAVISYQTPSGGWSKAIDYQKGKRAAGTHWTSQTGDSWHYCGTFDNRTTTEQLRLLAAVYSATKRDEVHSALLRGLDYLFDAQFPNGGWPQNYPIETGYHEAVTLNDNAMLHVLEVMLAISEKREPFAFADDTLRQRAQEAFGKGIACLARAQVRMDGKPTVWCAQYHPLTLEPVHARSKEPPSLSGLESASFVKFLMREAPINPENTAIIEAALHWFENHRLTGLRKVKNEKGKTDYIEDAASAEVYWARFYDLKTGRAVFPGSQDGILYPTFREMAAKNAVAYDFLTTKPADVIGKEVERWRKRLAKGR